MKTLWLGFRAGIREADVGEAAKIGAILGGAGAVIAIVLTALSNHPV